MPAFKLYWEHTLSQRYYQVTVEQDLLGDLVLIKRWGRQGTQLGGSACHLCASYEEATQRAYRIHQACLQHGYQLIHYQGITLPEQVK